MQLFPPLWTHPIESLDAIELCIPLFPCGRRQSSTVWREGNRRKDHGGRLNPFSMSRCLFFSGGHVPKSNGLVESGGHGATVATEEDRTGTAGKMELFPVTG